MKDPPKESESDAEEEEEEESECLITKMSKILKGMNNMMVDLNWMKYKQEKPNIDAKATEFASTSQELSSLKFCKWEKKFSTSQKQPDKINCGVMA